MTPDPALVEQVARRLRLTLAKHRALTPFTQDWPAVATALIAGLAEDGIDVAERSLMLARDRHPSRQRPARHPGRWRLSLVPEPSDE